MAALTLDQLTAAADAGEIDTVILAQVDMQGRMMGNRLHVRHFRESGYKESHSCNYLLAADLEMEPVPGFETTSWERGYGGYTMRLDLETLRLAPWLPSTALVLADILDHNGKVPVSVSPRAILQWQVERLAALGLSAKMASELEFFLFKESFEDAESAGYRSLSSISPYKEEYTSSRQRRKKVCLEPFAIAFMELEFLLKAPRVKRLLDRAN